MGTTYKVYIKEIRTNSLNANFNVDSPLSFFFTKLSIETPLAFFKNRQGSTGFATYKYNSGGVKLSILPLYEIFK